MHKFLIADDHPLFREAVIDLIETLVTTTEIFQACDFEQTLGLAQEHPDLDLVLLDVNMPGIDGLEGLAQLRQEFPLLPVVMISATEEKHLVLQAMNQGAAGFIAKSSARQEMSHAIQAILAGDVYLPASIMRQTPARPTLKSKSQTSLAQLHQLTRKQRLVLGRMIAGDSNKQIAAHLNIAETTVKAHVSAILAKLEVHNRVQAILLASELDFSQRISH